MTERLRTAVVAAVATLLCVAGLELAPGSPLHGFISARVDASAGTGSYAWLAHQRGNPDEPVAYDPCEPILVEVNTRYGPDDALALVQDSMAVIGEATGLELRYAGATDDRPQWKERFRPMGNPQEPVLVAWATEEEVPKLAGKVAGLGGSIRLQDIRGSRYVTGQVTLDADSFERFADDLRGEAKMRAVITHELGHLVGLAHVDDPTQLMYDGPLRQLELAEGDRAGLAALGEGRCF